MQLTIEKLIYGGDGLARLPQPESQPGAAVPQAAVPQPHPGPGKAVFVPFVLPGERVEARIVEEKPGFARALAGEILTRSPLRTEPQCPYFGYCGGCHYQHTGYEHQLAIKTQILKETVRRLGHVELPEVAVHPSPPWNYRNRTRMQVHGGRNFVLGYFRWGSRDLLPVEQCPISSELINRAIAALWELGRAGQVAEKILEIEFFANAEDTQLLVEINLPDGYWTDRSRPTPVDTVTALRAALPAIEGVAVFKKVQDGSLVREEVPKKLREVFGENELEYHAAHAIYQVSAGSFFQTNRFLTDELVRLAIQDRTGSHALDLYAGTGLFSLPLAQAFERVTAVEAAPFAAHDLKHNAPGNVAVLRETTEKFLSGLEDDASADFVLVDPPRAGLGEKVTRKLAALAPRRLTYVSCDPATLARDLRVLAEGGYRVTQAHLVDLFPQTFHMESVVGLSH